MRLLPSFQKCILGYSPLDVAGGYRLDKVCALAIRRSRTHGALHCSFARLHASRQTQEKSQERGKGRRPMDCDCGGCDCACDDCCCDCDCRWLDCCSSMCDSCSNANCNSWDCSCSRRRDKGKGGADNGYRRQPLPPRSSVPPPIAVPVVYMSTKLQPKSPELPPTRGS